VRKFVASRAECESKTPFAAQFNPIRPGDPIMTGSAFAAYGTDLGDVALLDVVCGLNRAGFANEDICMLLSPSHPVATTVRDARILGADREESAIGARMIGWVSEFGAVVIPTVGFFIRSQAFFRALLIEQDLPALSRGSGTLLGLGFSEIDARRLGRQLSDFGSLVYVSCQEKARAEWAIEVLRGTGALEVASLSGTKAAEAAA
jgi:hypothetical protein